MPRQENFVWSQGDIRRSAEEPPAPSGPAAEESFPPAVDSRRYPRLDRKLPILYKVMGQGASRVPEAARPYLAATSRDVSPIGLCLALAEPLAPGTVLALTIHVVEERERFEAVARVVWCRPDRDGIHHLTGLQFVVLDGERVEESRHAKLESLVRFLDAL